jgi:hypothetical protein
MATTHKPISVLPIKVNFVLEENGVIIAQPGIKSLAFFSTTHTKSDSFVYFLYNEFWFLVNKSLQRHPSLDNLRFFQLLNVISCLFCEKNSCVNFLSK